MLEHHNPSPRPSLLRRMLRRFRQREKMPRELVTGMDLELPNLRPSPALPQPELTLEEFLYEYITHEHMMAEELPRSERRERRQQLRELTRLVRMLERASIDPVESMPAKKRFLIGEARDFVREQGLDLLKAEEERIQAAREQGEELQEALRGDPDLMRQAIRQLRQRVEKGDMIGPDGEPATPDGIDHESIHVGICRSLQRLNAKEQALGVITGKYEELVLKRGFGTEELSR